MHANTAHAAPALTETTAPDPATPAAVGNGKINSNHAQPIDGQTASCSPPANQDSDVTSVASTGESNGYSDYVELTKNSPTSQANTPDLAGNIRILEEMYEVADSELVELTQPMVLFSQIDKFKPPELVDSKTVPPENHQDNGNTPRIFTQPSTPHSPLEYASVAPAVPPPHPRVEASDAALQVLEI